MQLSINGDDSNQRVTNELIATTVASLVDEDEFFLILSKDDMSYMQVSGSSDAGFVLEYQEASIEEHFSCDDAPLDTKQIVSALQSYLDVHERWRQDYRWSKLDLGSAPTSVNVSPKTIFLVVSLALTGLVAWYLLT